MKLRFITRPLIILLLFFDAPALVSQQVRPFARIHYNLAMSRPASHLFEVRIDTEVGGGTVQDHIDFQIPRWQPGRYAIADFSKNIQEFKAVAAGTTLPVTRADDQTWRVQTLGHPNVTVTYKVFGNDLSGTYAQLDVEHANLNGGEIYMYLVGHKSDAVELHIDPPPGWRVISSRSDQLTQTDWKFPNYELLIDNPTEIGAGWTLDEFKTGGKTYRVVVHSRGNEGGLRPGFVRDVQRIVEAETRMWGVPDFDYFTFLVHFAADDRSGDGMEHLTAAQIIEPGSLDDSGNYRSALDSVAHEFFHAWNVKRLRPVELGPWDWTKPVTTRSLWIAEGLTQYYGEIMTARAGLRNDDVTFAIMSRSIAAIENSTGSRLMNAEDSSLAAVLMDGALDRQRTNLENTSVNYYYKGETIGLVLDLLIRGKSRGARSLDDVMRKMYDDFYVKAPNANYYLKGRGYTPEDFMRAVSAVAGSDMSDFFVRHVRGVEPLPYSEALAYVGLRLTKNPVFRDGGILVDATDGNLKVRNIRSNSAAERAGIQEDDVLLAIGGTRVTSDTWRRSLNSFQDGERVPFSLRRNGKPIEVVLVQAPSETFDYRIEQDPNAPPHATAMRASWLRGTSSN